MKKLILPLLTLLALVCAVEAARANDSIPEEDTFFSGMEMPGEEDDSSAGGAGADDGASLEAAADHYRKVCYAKLGPYAACFEDYYEQSCVEQRRECREAGAYSH